MNGTTDPLKRLGQMALALDALMAMPWAFDHMIHYGHQQDAIGQLLPEPPGARDPGTLDVDAMLFTAWRSSGNELASGETEGRPVAVNARLASVKRDDGEIVVRMDVYKRDRSSLLTLMGPSTTLECRYPDAIGDSPLSGWMIGQEMAVAASAGRRRGELKTCRLSAYVNDEGRPAGNGRVLEVADGRVRRLDAAQVFPR